MHLTSSTVELPGQMAGYYAYPTVAKEPLPGVIVIQEIWGIDAHMRDVTERVAAAGYAAIAPALFSAGGLPAELAEPRVEAVKAFLDLLPPASWMNLMDPGKRETELQRVPDAQRAAIRETIGSLFAPDRFARMATYAQHLEGVAGWLRARPEVGGSKIAAMGFCLGGGLAGMLAARDPQLAGAVIYYGQPPSAEAIAKLACPILGLFGKDDERLVTQLPAFEQAMKQADKRYELHVYPGAPHAFFNDTRSAYRATASRDAWARTLAFLSRVVG